MVGNASMMDKIEKIAPVAIGLPNGTYTMACEKGLVVLAGKLGNILCMQKLNCNLILVSKLCTHLNCVMTFFMTFV